MNNLDSWKCFNCKKKLKSTEVFGGMQMPCCEKCFKLRFNNDYFIWNKYLEEFYLYSEFIRKKQPSVDVPRYFLFVIIGLFIWLTLSYFGLAMIDYQYFFSEYRNFNERINNLEKKECDLREKIEKLKD